MAEQKKLNLKLDFLKTELDSSLNASIMNFNNSVNNDVNLWAQTDLRRNVENSMSKFAGNLQGIGHGGGSGSFGGGGSGGPGDGLKATLSLQIMVGYKTRKPKWKLSANVGYGKRWGDAAANATLNFGLYNGGLGTAVNSDDIEFDLTASVNMIVGSGHGKPLQSYTINNNSPIPNLNEFANSFRYGQALTFNSALNKENKFSFDQVQREGLVGFRIGDVNVSTNNDTSRFPYGGGGTDKGFTGGISIVMPFLEFGSQTFTGDYAKSDDVRTGALKKKIENETDPIEKKRLENELKKLTLDFFHTQTPFQRSLNQSSLYIKHNNDGFNGTIDFIGEGYLQNIIHKKINNHMFDFQHKDIEFSIGKKF